MYYQVQHVYKCRSQWNPKNSHRSSFRRLNLQNRMAKIVSLIIGMYYDFLNDSRWWYTTKFMKAKSPFENFIDSSQFSSFLDTVCVSRLCWNIWTTKYDFSIRRYSARWDSIDIDNLTKFLYSNYSTAIFAKSSILIVPLVYVLSDSEIRPKFLTYHEQISEINGSCMC